MTGRLISMDELDGGTPLEWLPWQRRERCDANIRRAITELRALAVEDAVFGTQYRAMADAFQSALGLLDAIEDFG